MTFWQVLKGWWLYLRVLKAADRLVDAEIAARDMEQRLSRIISECRSNAVGDSLLGDADTVEKALDKARAERAVSWLKGEQ